MDLRATVPLLLLLLLGTCDAQFELDDAEDEADNEIFAHNSETEDMTTTILRMNNGSRDNLIEGDVFIPKTRSAMKCFNKKYSCLWPKSANGKVEIGFVISKKYDNTERNTILDAMKGFEPNTCIRFIPRTTQREYLHIEPKFGCFSALGRIGVKQVVGLQRFGCIQKGIIQHELLHSLGFYHEHTRSDRDKYVKINWENVIDMKELLYNFERQDTNNLNLPYDYSSVMHYGRKAFGKPGLETITPIPDSSVPIGQRDSMSTTDIRKLKKLYQC